MAARPSDQSLSFTTTGVVMSPELVAQTALESDLMCFSATSFSRLLLSDSSAFETVTVTLGAAVLRVSVSAPCLTLAVNLTPLSETPLTRSLAALENFRPFGNPTTIVLIDGAPVAAVTLNDSLGSPLPIPESEPFDTVAAAAIAQVKVVVADGAVASVAVTVTGEPPSVVGVPEMMPLCAPIERAAVVIGGVNLQPGDGNPNRPGLITGTGDRDGSRPGLIDGTGGRPALITRTGGRYRGRDHHVPRE